MVHSKAVRYGLLVTTLLLVACGNPAEKEKKYLLKAQEAFNAQNLDKTRVELKNVLQINPKNTDALFLLAKIAERDRDLRKMYGLLSGIVTEKPDFFDAQILLGKLLLLGGQIDKATEKVSLVLAKNPEHKDALILQALVLLQKNDKTAAQGVINKVLAMHPADIEGTALLVKLYGESKRYDEALKALDAALAAHPEELNLALMKMQLLTTAGQADAASNMVEELLKRFPDQNALYYNMAKHYVSRQQPDKAEQVLQRLIAQKPDQTEPKLKLVEYFLNQKLETKAEQTLKEYLEANPKAYELSFALVSLYGYQQKIEQASPILNQVITDDGNGPNSLKAKNMLASFALKKADKPKAEQLVEEVIKADAHNADALIMRSTLLLEASKYDAAIADLRTVLRDQPNSERVNILAARAYLKSGYYDLAQESLKNTLTINPANLDIRLDLAKLLVMKKDELGAITLLEELNQGQQQKAEVLAMLADLYARKGDWTKAEATANSIAKVNDSGFASFKMAQLYAAQKKFPAAIDAYQEALKLKPFGLDIIAGLTNTYLAMGESSKASTFLDKLLATQPNAIGLLNLKGSLYLNLKKFTEAEQTFSKVLNLAKQEEAAYRNLAAVYILQDQLDKALNIYQQGLAVLPQNTGLMQNLAKLYEKQGNLAAAIDLYTQLLKINPENVTAANNFAALTAEVTDDPKRLTDALSLVKRFKNHQDPTYLDTFGWLSYLNGQLDDAVYALEKVVKLQPEFPEFNYHLGMAYAAKGRREEAKSTLQKALSKNVNANWVEKAKLKAHELL